MELPVLFALSFNFSTLQYKSLNLDDQIVFGNIQIVKLIDNNSAENHSF